VDGGSFSFHEVKWSFDKEARTKVHTDHRVDVSMTLTSTLVKSLNIKAKG
jgi:hypothetical protein